MAHRNLAALLVVTVAVAAAGIACAVEMFNEPLLTAKRARPSPPRVPSGWWEREIGLGYRKSSWRRNFRISLPLFKSLVARLESHPLLSVPINIGRRAVAIDRQLGIVLYRLAHSRVTVSFLRWLLYGVRASSFSIGC